MAVKVRVLAALLCLLSACGEVNGPWVNTASNAAYGACVAATIGDAVTTALAQGAGGHERNPVLGRHPGNAIVAIYFAGAVGAETLAWWMLPGWVTAPAFAACAAGEGYETAHNAGVIARLDSRRG